MTLTDETRTAIDNLLADHPVVLFMKGNRQQPQCGFSAKTVSALDMLLPDYVTIDVLQYPEIRDGIKVYGNWPTIPQLYVNGELVGGSDIVLEMMASGELADTLGVEAPDPGPVEISIGEAAAAAIDQAAQEQPDMAIHLQIDAGWSHTLSLGPTGPQNVHVEAGGIRLQLDPWSAARANGLRIELEETLSGTRFAFDNPNAPPPVRQMTVHELKERMDKGKVHLIDVRDADERDKASIEGARPWNRETVEFLNSLPKDEELIFHCHTGGRSQSAAEQYRRSGYINVWNLQGGIEAWSAEIDPDQPGD